MPAKQSGPTKADLEQLLDDIAEKADEALTPAATRSELVEALQAIYEMASGEDDEESGTEPGSDEDDD